MAYKIFTRGNVFYIVDTTNERERDGLAKNVRVTRGTTVKTDFCISGVNDWENDTKIDILDIQKQNGDTYTVDEFVNFYESSTGEQSSSYTKLSTNDIGLDSWGRPKVINDNSIFHGMFTYNVPVTTWEERLNDVTQVFTNATSVDGKLRLEAGATLDDSTLLRTFRNPRYEPNRGHLYSTSVFFPSPTELGFRRFGYFTHESGAFFELENGNLYAVVRTTVQTVTTNDRYLINTSEYDLSKGNTYDIQMQWRGVGGYKFYINLEEVKHIDYIGTRDELTMFNPANPLCFECENKGNNVVLFAGCVDVTSEGGKQNGKTYGSISIDNDNGEVSISGLNSPIIAVRSKLTVGGLINTRDTLALLATAYSDSKAIVRVWATRDFTAITENDQVWRDFGDGHLEFITYDVPDITTPMAFDPAKAQLIFSSRVDANSAYSTSALFEGRTEIYQTPGDMFVFTIHTKTGGQTNAGLTYEFAEEI